MTAPVRRCAALLAAIVSLASCARTAQQWPGSPGTPARAPAAENAPRGGTSTAPPVPAHTSAVADEIVSRTNIERRTAKLPPLTRSVSLMRAAELQAGQMARAGKMEHELPGSAYPTLASRLSAVQYQMLAAGENIGLGFSSPAAALAAWMKSAGHRANILSPRYTEMGSAMSAAPDGRRYWVQVFGRPR